MDNSGFHKRIAIVHNTSTDYILWDFNSYTGNSRSLKFYKTKAASQAFGIWRLLINSSV